jgi:DNA repair ATPase RecN
MVDRNFRVAKETISSEYTGNGNSIVERTIVRIEELHSQQQRRDEIAQIAGGQSA